MANDERAQRTGANTPTAYARGAWPTRLRPRLQMCLLLRECLTVGKIALSQHFFSNELANKEARLRIKDELSSYCIVTEPPKTTFGKV